MFEVARKEFPGEIGVVCPGAGVYEPHWSSFWYPPPTETPTEGTTPDNYDSLAINLVHPIRTTQLAIQHHLSRQSRSSEHSLSIIHISSIAGQASPLIAPLYNATKHGINGFVRTLAPLSSSIGIRVAAVAPGVIKTPLWTEAPEKLRLVSKSDTWVSPEEVAECMGDLVCEDEIDVQESGWVELEPKEKVKVEGGMVVEVSAKGRRVVQQYMDPGPEGKKGNTVGYMVEETERLLERLSKGEF